MECASALGSRARAGDIQGVARCGEIRRDRVPRCLDRVADKSSVLLREDGIARWRQGPWLADVRARTVRFPLSSTRHAASVRTLVCGCRRTAAPADPRAHLA